MSDWRPRLLEALCETPILNTACRAVGVKPMVVTRAIESDEDFRKAVNRSIEVGKGEAEDALWKRAVQGVDEPVLSKGQQVMVIDEVTGETVPLTKKVYSDSLLAFYLKAQKPEVYGDRTKVEIETQAVLVAPAIELEDLRSQLAKRRQEQSEL